MKKLLKFYSILLISILITSSLVFWGYKGVYSEENLWTMFQGNSKRNGESDLSLLLPLKEAWNLPIGEKDTQKWMFSSPVYEDRKVYVGDNKGYLYCVDSESSKVLWSKKVSTKIFSTPALGEKNVYVVGYDGKLYAIDKKKGDVEWSKSIGLKFVSPLYMNGKCLYSNFKGKFIWIQRGW